MAAAHAAAGGGSSQEREAGSVTPQDANSSTREERSATRISGGAKGIMV